MTAFTSTILVTGGTTGLGYWAAYELARQSPTSRVIISSRSDRENAQKSLNEKLAKERSARTSTSSQIEFIPLDLCSNANVRAYAKELSSRNYPPISSLVLNAGAQFHEGNDIRYSTDGVELTFATNLVGHALLLFLLKSHLANDTRIVLLGSGTHDPELMAKSRLVFPIAKYDSAELLAHPTDKEGYKANDKGVQRYGSAKLAVLMWGSALERRLSKLRDSSDKKWTVMTMEPGLTTGTSLARDSGAIKNWVFLHLAPWLPWLFRYLTGGENVYTPQQSGANLAFNGSKSYEVAKEESGKYIEQRKIGKRSADSMNEAKQEDVWKWIIDFVGQSEEERKAFETF